MSSVIDVLLLLALPASGKSEVRRYLEHLDPDRARSEMHLGPTVQLDDYPYVHLMRRISQELSLLGTDPIFFSDDLSPWNDPRDWLTLIHLVNEDYLALGTGTPADPSPAALLERIDRARHTAGAPALLGPLTTGVRNRLEAALAADTAELATSLPRNRPPDSTVVIEFARGGPDGADLPLPHPLGYAASLAALDPSIIERSSILYVWVEPAESRRRNRDRARPGPEGDASILHHGVPEAVMLQDYGTDDMAWLRSQARRDGTIPVGDHDLPCAWFDNRRDHTSFLRSDPAEWSDPDVDRLHSDLTTALNSLVGGM
jgi:hypothetical protein